MKLFPNQITAIEYLLNRVVHDGNVLDVELKYQIEQNKKWGSKDRKNFYQACYDIIRNYEFLKVIGEKSNESILDVYVRLIAESKLDMIWIEENYPDMNVKDQYSIPTSLFEIFDKENRHAIANLQAMHTVGNIYLRINTSLIAIEEFEKKLEEHAISYRRIDKVEIENRAFPVQAIQLFEHTQKHREFFEANKMFFEIQDLGSQVLTEFIDFSEAKTIVESCAGNGGKTTHILDKTYQNKVLIVALDIERKKIEHLRERVSKWKNHKVVTDLAKEKEIMKYDLMADILYMDMPCTGSGTLKRQSDLKYRITQAVLDDKVKTQREIFHVFHDTLKRGGTLVYSTCSLFQSENESQVDYIQSKGYELIDSLVIEPRMYDGDGFFVATLRKI